MLTVAYHNDTKLSISMIAPFLCWCNQVCNQSDDTHLFRLNLKVPCNVKLGSYKQNYQQGFDRLQLLNHNYDFHQNIRLYQCMCYCEMFSNLSLNIFLFEVAGLAFQTVLTGAIRKSA